MKDLFMNIILAGLGLILLSVGIGLFFYVISALVSAFCSAIRETKEVIEESKEKESDYEDLKELAEIGKEVIISCHEGSQLIVRDSVAQKLTPNAYWARLTESSFHDITGRELGDFRKYF